MYAEFQLPDTLLYDSRVKSCICSEHQSRDESGTCEKVTQKVNRKDGRLDFERQGGSGEQRRNKYGDKWIGGKKEEIKG